METDIGLKRSLINIKNTEEKTENLIKKLISFIKKEKQKPFQEVYCQSHVKNIRWLLETLKKNEIKYKELSIKHELLNILL